MNAQPHYTISLTDLELTALKAALYEVITDSLDISDKCKHDPKMREFFDQKANALGCITRKVKASEHGNVIHCELDNDFNPNDYR